MGLSRCAIYLSASSAAEALSIVHKAGLLPSKIDSRSAQDQSCIGREEIGIIEENGWGLIFADSASFFQEDALEFLKSASYGRVVFMWLTQSTCGGIWFELWKDGKLIRKWIEVEGTVVENFGPTIPQESEGVFSGTPLNEDLDEWSVIELAEAVTGISVSRIFDEPFTVFFAASDN